MKQYLTQGLFLSLSFFLFSTNLSAQFTEEFEGVGTPAGWTVLNFGDPNGWEFGSAMWPANNGFGYAYIMYDQSIAHDDYLITPQISVTTEISDQLRFFAKNIDMIYSEEFDLLISTSGLSQSDFTTTLEGSIAPPSSWTEYTYDLSAFVGQDIYIAFKATSLNMYGLLLDDISIEAIPSCPAPKELAMHSATATSADLSWTEEGTATVWNIEYGVAGFTAGTGTSENGVTSNSHTLSGLTPDTDYEFYVQADCGNADLSVWTGPFSFSNYYCEVSSTETFDYLKEVTSYGAITDVSYISNSLPSGSYADERTQTFETMEGESFDIETNFSSTNNGVTVWVDWNKDFAFDDSEKASNQHGSHPIKISTISIPVGTPPGDYRMRIRGQYGGYPPACGNINRGHTVDFTLTVLPLPSCLKPIDLSASNFTYTPSDKSADLAWTELNGASIWNIEYGPSGFTQGAGTLVNGVNSNPYTLDGLAEGDNNEFYVQSDCGGGDLSAWAGPFEFAVDYCEVSSTNTTKYLNKIMTSGAESDLSFWIFSYPSGSYSDETTQVLETYENQEVSLVVIYQSMYTEEFSAQVWIDWNNDYNFDPSEELVNITANSQGSIPFTIPSGTAPGNYRMRIRGQPGSIVPPACGNIEFGSTVDFTITVLPSPVCAYPTGLSATNVSQSSVDLEWDANYGVNTWNVEYGIVGFAQGTGTILNGLTSNNYNVTGLNPAKDYEYYVQSDCGNNDLSTWSEPFPFFNFYCPVSTSNSYAFMSLIESSGAEMDISYSTTSSPTGSYSNETAQVFEAYETQVISIDIELSYGITGTQVWIDWNEDYDFEESEKVAYTSGSSLTQTLSIPVPAGTPPGDYRMRIRSETGSYVYPLACGNSGTGSTVDFTLTVVPSPVCANPTGLNTSNISLNTVDLGWDVNYGVGVWNIEYDTAGFTLGTGTFENNITNNSHSVSILPDTEYHFYVQSDCGGGDESVWAGPYAFDTKYCEVSSNSPEYLTVVSSNGAEVNINYSATVKPTNSYADELAQTFEVVEGQDLEMRTVFSSGSNGVAIWVDWNNNYEFEANEIVASSTISDLNKEFSFSIPTGIPVGDYRMRVRSRSGGGIVPEACGQDIGGSTVDFTLSVIPIPSCVHPTDINISNISGTSAELTWTENGNASSWNIEHGVSGFTMGSGTIENSISSNPYTIDFTPYTDYQIYVQSDCGNGDLSTWSGYHLVNIDYCAPKHQSVPYYLTSIESNGAVSDVSYTAGTRPTNGYSVDTALVFEAYPNQTFALNTSYYDNYRYKVKIWVDWNQDYEFDSTELLDTVILGYGSIVHSINVPAGTPIGDYRMRVRAWTDPSPHVYPVGPQTDPSACENQNYGSSVDLKLKVLTPPVCISPNAITTSNKTFSSIDIDWIGNGLATEWNIEYGPVGFINGAGSTISGIASESYTLTGLNDNTDYEFYVQSDCGINQSSWQGPVSFTTFEECFAPSLLTVSNITTTSADLGWTENGSATSWNVEYGTLGFMQGAGTLENGVSNDFTITINPDTEYQFYVQSDCGGGNKSEWVGPLLFDNMYCGVIANDDSHFFSEVKSGGALTDVSYLTNACPPGSYADETAQTFEVYENQEFFINTTTNNSRNVVNIWVDWDNNIEFDSTELVSSSASSFVEISQLITVPAGTPIGEYRMRIRGRNVYNFNLEPCGGFYFGNSSIDFTLKVVAPPACLSPSGLIVSNILSTSADLEWVESGAATSWNIEYGISGFTQGTGTVENGVSSPHSVPTTPDTQYEFYVQADCGGGDESTWSGPFRFRNEYCDVSGSNLTDYLEEVSSYGALTEVFYSTTSQPSNSYIDRTSQFFEAHEGQVFEMNTVFSRTDNNIAIWVDWNEDFVFQPDELVAYVGNTNTVNTLSISVPAGTPQGEYRMRVYGDFGAPVVPLPCFPTSVIDFTLTVVSTPTCWKPTQLTSSNATATSADLGWTEAGTATSWNIEYGLSGFSIGNGTLENGVTSPQTVSITAGLDYEFYVQSDCGGGDESSWAGPFAFKSMYCVANSVQTNGWLSRIISNGGITDIDYYSYPNPLVDYVDETAQTFEVVENQTLNINTIYNTWVNGVYIWIDWNNDYVFDSNELVSSQYSANALKTAVISIPSGIPLGEYRMRVRGMYGDTTNLSACGYIETGSTVDFTITVLPTPSCVPPTGLAVSNITPTSADINWTGSGTGASYNIEYGLQGFTRGTGTLESGVSNAHTIPVILDTEYEYYMQADCGGGDESVWVGPYAFETSYCFVVSPANHKWLSGVSSSGAITDFSYSALTFPVGGYAIETAIDFEAYESQSISINTVYEDEANGVNIWIDWDHNMLFDFSELMASQANSSLSKTLTFTVPAGTPEGEYRMRIRGVSGVTANPSPCNLNGWGSAVDFTLTVVATPACLSPSNLMASNLTTSSVDLGWTHNGTATEWNIEYGVAGFIQGTGTTENNVTQNPYVVNGLSSDTDFEFYVQADCGTDQSTWVGPYSFTTLQGPSQIIITNIGADSAVVNWIDNSAALDWGIEYGLSGFTIGTGTVISTTDNPYTITGLSSNTTYDVYIWGNYGSNLQQSSQLIVVGPHTFTTESCVLLSLDSMGVCKNEPLDLVYFLGLGVDTGGTWLDPNGLALTSSEIVSSETAGLYNYTYLPSVVSGCSSDTAFVLVTVEDECDYLSVNKEGLTDITVYPNPTKNILNIVNPSNISSLKVEILDMNGRIVLVENAALNNVTGAVLKIDHLERGVYMLRVYNNEGQKTFKIVKQ